jgi:hypothetical protein
MKKNPCKFCLVKPSCTAGCGKLWNYREYLEKKFKQTSKLGRNFLILAAFESFLNAIMLVLDYGFKQYYHWIAYSLLIIPAMFLIFIRSRIIRKQMHKIDTGPCSEFVVSIRDHQMFHDIMSSRLRKKKPKSP